MVIPIPIQALTTLFEVIPLFSKNCVLANWKEKCHFSLFVLREEEFSPIKIFEVLLLVSYAGENLVVICCSSTFHPPCEI
ncbi:hypothetical protein Ccrd_010435, partial [Cynara cardunculus var. scolymus]